MIYEFSLGRCPSARRRSRENGRRRLIAHIKAAADGGIGVDELQGPVVHLLNELMRWHPSQFCLEFRIEGQFPLTALLSRKQIDTHVIVEEQVGGMLAQDVCRLLCEQKNPG